MRSGAAGGGGSAGEAFGPYRLLTRLGAGPMGESWRALDTHKDREIAITMLAAWLGDVDGYPQRFRQEAALAAGLYAPNIVPIYDYGEIDGRMFLESPLVAGSDLDIVVARSGALDPARAVGVIEQLAEALDVAHDASLVHGDVTPSTVLLGSRRNGDDLACLLDLGIARPPTPDQRSTRSGNVWSALACTAPERFDGVSDPLGDVYSLACLLFHALTGQAPYVPPDAGTGPHPGDAVAFHRAARRQPPPRPSARRGVSLGALDDVVARGMAEDPRVRYRSAGALARAARAALTGLVWPPRRLLMITKAGYPVWEEVRSAPPTPAEPLEERRFTGHAGPVRAVAATLLDGRPVVVSASADSTVRIGDVHSGRWLPPAFTGHRDSVLAVATAQVGGRPVVVSGGTDTTVQVWDLRTRKRLAPPVTLHAGPVRAVATTEVGGQPVAISASLDGTVWVWDLVTGQPLGPPFTGHAGLVLAVAVAQVDDRPVVVSSGDDPVVLTWDLTTRTRLGRPFTGHTDTVFAVATAQVTGRAVAVSGSGDRTVQVWDLVTGGLLAAPFTGHTDAVFAVATLQLGGRPTAVSGGADTTVRLGDLATGEPLGTVLPNHDDHVYAVAAAHLDGRAVVLSGGVDRTVRVRDLGHHPSGSSSVGSPATAPPSAR